MANTRGSWRSVAAVLLAALATACSSGPSSKQLDRQAEIDRAVALTRLIGYVRFFHPSEKAKGLDWDGFAIQAIGRIDRLGQFGESDRIDQMPWIDQTPWIDMTHRIDPERDPAALAEAFRSLFRPVAPSVEVFASGGSAPGAPAIASGDPAPGAPEVPASGSAPRGRVYSSTGPGAGGEDGEKEVFVADLGAGIASRVPLGPHIALDVSHASARSFRTTPAPGPALATARQKDVHLAALGMAWNYIQHFYPYKDEVAQDWAGALEWAVGETLTLHDTSMTDDERDRLFLRILRHLVARARDSQAAVTSPYAADADYRPPIVCRLVDGHLIVTGPATGPVPVRPGDEIIRIEGVGPRLKMSYSADLISGSTERSVLHVAANEILAGPKDSPVTLRVMAAGRRPRFVMVHRTQDSAHRASDVRPGPIAEVAPDIHYLGIGRATDADVSGALHRLAKARGLILDFREKPKWLSLIGTLLPHLIDRPITSVPFDHPVFRRPDQLGNRLARQTWSVAPKPPYLSARIAFLVDAGTVGEREVLLEMARHRGLGEIVGEPSAGMSGDVDSAALPGGYGLSWTRVKALRYDGSRSHGVGVEPTIAASLTREGLRQGRDDILEAAIAALKGYPRP